MSRVLIVGLLFFAFSTISGQEKEKSPKSNELSVEEPKFPDIDQFMKKLKPDLPADEVARIRRGLEWAEFLAKDALREKANFKKINENNSELIRRITNMDA